MFQRRKKDREREARPTKTIFEQNGNAKWKNFEPKKKE